nr:hypothetical protein [Porphyridium purpureum]UBY46134.1 hypothetical protein [Porphyridium purpureum]
MKLQISTNSDTKFKHWKNGTVFLGFKINRKNVRFYKPTNCWYKSSSTLNFGIPVKELYTEYAKKGFFRLAKCRNNKRFVARRFDKLLYASPWYIVVKYNIINQKLISYYKGSQKLSNLYKLLYSLKRSCALTLAHAVRKRTARWAFLKYGANLEVKDKNNKSVSFNLSLLKKSTKPIKHKWKKSSFLYDPKPKNWLNSKTLNIVCTASNLICGIPECQNIAYSWYNFIIREKSSKSNLNPRATRTASKIPICRSHNESIQIGKYDGPSLKRLKAYENE